MDLERDEYQEPRCPMDMSALQGGPAETIPVRRITEKEDEFLAKNDWTGAERLLLYWLAEADQYGDKKGSFAMNNELMGLYRKLGREEKAMESASKALALLDELGYEDTVSGATCFINSATVFKAFGRAGDALPLFEKARKVYERLLKNDDARLGGLYNNMGLALVDLERFDEADALYGKAVAVMERTGASQPEQAISWLNMASAAEARLGLDDAEEEISDCIARAMELLDKDQPHDGNYAFVCEKCAPVFGYYGYFMYEEELNERARKIYERS
ncbi:MAG: tetratricopeptide repeat protein [Firmicutes bacterium]|nr:tetratricopeptide repeat protein [Bacillota bacterium]MBQ1523705.1 tetratricopeptide repeat protein [Bacillota bacterium]